MKCQKCVCVCVSKSVDIPVCHPKPNQGRGLPILIHTQIWLWVKTQSPFHPGRVTSLLASSCSERQPGSPSRKERFGNSPSQLPEWPPPLRPPNPLLPSTCRDTGDVPREPGEGTAKRWGPVDPRSRRAVLCTGDLWRPGEPEQRRKKGGPHQVPKCGCAVQQKKKKQ